MQDFLSIEDEKVVEGEPIWSIRDVDLEVILIFIMIWEVDNHDEFRHVAVERVQYVRVERWMLSYDERHIAWRYLVRDQARARGSQR